MRTKLIIIIGGIALLVFAGLLITFFGKTSTLTAQPSGAIGTTGTAPVPVSNFGTAPTGAHLLLQTPQGQVSVNNFYNGTTVATDTPAVSIASGDGYAIWYFRADSSFEVQLSGNASARTVAESALVSALGVSKADACKLNVSVTVPTDGGAQQAPIGSLSFCPQH